MSWTATACVEMPAPPDTIADLPTSSAPAERLGRAIRGEPAAIGDLVEQLRPRLARMAAYYARHTGQDAEDLLQEAYQGMLEALPVLDLAIGTPAQYLIARARWRLLDAARKAALARRRLPEALARPEIDRDAGHLGDAVEVTEFLCALPPQQRAVLECLLEGLTWREAAARLGCTHANIAYHLRQIRARYVALHGAAA